MADQIPLTDLLDAAVAAVGGEPRPGQQQMAVAAADALETGEHLLVQAGTGTGKSLAYLVPALAHHDSVVVATATIALQRQLVDRDLPRLVEALEPLLGRRPTFALLKGRSNYLCLHRLHTGDDADDQEVLFDPAPTSKAGRDAVRIRSWAESTTTGDRDELLPAPDDRAWRSLSVTPHECLGQRCPYAEDCFAELARDRARDSDVVVTNHAMLTIDALSDARLLPDVDVVVVDEAHELADRATGAVTDELTVLMVERAARRARQYAGE
ncbi:MAG: ATP-dependent DNA helicase, partial [Candidatus Nanopelagicales bacterium]